MKTWTDKELEFLNENFRTMSYPEIANELGKSLGAVSAKAWMTGLRRTHEEQVAIMHRTNTGMFQKGNKPWSAGTKGCKPNSGSFKKGNKPYNTKSGDGYISVRQEHQTGRFYQWIRISLGKWIQLHQHLWIQANGPIPKGHIVVFKNGDCMDARLENLELVSHAENLRRNRKDFLSLKKTIREIKKELKLDLPKKKKPVKQVEKIIHKPVKVSVPATPKISPKKRRVKEKKVESANALRHRLLIESRRRKSEEEAKIVHKVIFKAKAGKLWNNVIDGRVPVRIGKTVIFVKPGEEATAKARYEKLLN